MLCHWWSVFITETHKKKTFHTRKTQPSFHHHQFLQWGKLKSLPNKTAMQMSFPLGWHDRHIKYSTATDWCMVVGKRSNFPKATGIKKSSATDDILLLDYNLFETLQIFLSFTINLFFSFILLSKWNCWRNDAASAI